MIGTREKFEEVQKQVDDLCARVHRAEGRISRALAKIRFLDDHSSLPGEYLLFLDERGYFAALRNLGLPNRKNHSRILRGLELMGHLNRSLQQNRENLFHSCGSVHESWDPFSDKWNFLLQEAASMKEGRMAFLEYAEEVRSSVEALPVDFSGPIEELVRSIERNEIAIDEDRERGDRDACTTIEKHLRELRSDLAVWEAEVAAGKEEREKLVPTLREMGLELRREQQRGS